MEWTSLWELTLHLTLKRQDFVEKLLNIIWILTRSRNQNFFEVRTGTVINLYGLRTLSYSIRH